MLVLAGCLAGSGRSFTAYVFNKAAPALALPVPLALEAAAAQSVETPAQAAEALPAAPSSVAGQAAVEAEGETAQSRLAEAAGAALPAAGAGGAAGRGRRQRKPSAKQQAAVEAKQATAAVQVPAGQGPGITRQQKAAELAPQSVEQQGAREQPAQPPDPAQAADHAAVPQRSPRRLGRSVSRPVAAASTAKPTALPAAKLSSPQRAGVHKRTSPVKPATVAAEALPPAVRRSPRSLALSGAAAAKGRAAAEAQLPAPGAGGPLLQQGSVRVVKAGGAAAGKAAQGAPRRSARRGLLEGN